MAGRVLFLTPSCPLPQVSGDRIRSYNLMRQLAQRGWRVSLFTLVRPSDPASADLSRLHELCERVYFERDETSQAARLARLLGDLVRREAFQRHYFSTAHARAQLRSLFAHERFDVVIFSRLYGYGWLPEELRGVSVLDSQNSEERRLGALIRTDRFGPRGAFARLQLGPVVNFEREVVTSVPMTLAVSEQEFQHFERLAPGRVRLVPNGVNTGELRPRNALPPDPRVLFVGSLDYSANVDAVRHLARTILPHVRRRDVTVTVIGANAPRAVYAAARRAPVQMDVLGYVEDLRPYVEASRCLVVPLRYGGGTRLKILEALSQGLPVISTGLGCEGLDLTHGDELIVADEPRAFAGWIDRLCEDDDLCARLSMLGRKKVESNYEWSTIGDALHSALVEFADGPASVVVDPT